MLPASFPEVNVIFEKPPGTSDEDCMDLPVFKGYNVDRQPVIISCWRFSKEDLEEIARTGCIYLTIFGEGLPPVGLQTESPFQQP